MNGADHQNATTTQARADIRALLAEVPDELHPRGKWFPGRGLGVLADLLIGKWYACDPARRQGNGVEWPPGNLSKMADEVEDALAFYAGDNSGYLDELTAASMFEQGDSWGFADIIDWLRGLDLCTLAGRRLAADMFDEAMRFMVHRHGDSLGQFVTPAPVVDLMVALADPAPGEKVYDPCFGFGGLLVEALRRTRGATDPSSPGQDVGPAAIAGIESDWRAYSVGLCRLVLAGVDRPDLTCGDALVKPLPGDRDARRYDCILAAPPWGDDEEQTDHIEDRFLRHVMGCLRPGGRAVIAVPEQMLLRDESTDLRKELLEEYRVDGVVSVPPAAFEPHTSVGMSVVVFRCAEPRETMRLAVVSPTAWGAAVADESVGADGQTKRGFPIDGELLRALSAIGSPSELPAGTLLPGVEMWDASLDEVALHYIQQHGKSVSAQLLDSWIDLIAAADSSLAVERLDAVAEVLNPYEDLVFEESFLYLGDLIVPLGSDDGEADVTVVGDVTMVDSRYEWLYDMERRFALVRVRDGIKSRYLAAIFGSPAYRSWLMWHAVELDTGEVTGALDTLRIPAPPPVVQDAVLEELDGPGADALAVLHRLLAEVSGHPVAVWLEKPLPARLAVGGGTVAGADDGQRTLSEMGRGLAALSPSAHSGRANQPLDAWLSAARRAGAALEGVDSIPSGAGRLAVLEFALVRLHEALTALGDAEGHVIERLRSVTRVLVDLAEHEVYAMQRSITLDLDVEPIEVVAGDTSEVVVRASNASAVPLRNVQLMARCPDGTVEERAADYVAERGTHDLPIAVRPTGEERSLQIAVEWRARRFDGKPVGDEGTVSLLVRDNRAQYRTGAEAGDLGDSPYVVGSPVERQEMFFGRTEVMEVIKRQLGKSTHANVILLEGNRRTGKTSILRQVAKDDVVLRDWIPVDCSLQAASGAAASDQTKAGITTREFFRLIARKTGRQLFAAGIETWFPDLPDRDPKQPFSVAFRNALKQAFASSEYSFETLEHYLEAAVKAIRPRRILLMFDEFDALHEGIEAGVTSPLTPSNIRYLLQKSESGLSAIIAGSRRLTKLRENYWSALFGLGRPIPISKLPIDGAKLLVTKPVKGKLRYLPQACDRLVELCACHPFLIQSLCSRVFDRAVTGSGRTITRDIVEQAATDMVRDSEHLRTLWDYAGTERRRLMLALCDRLADRPDAVNLRLLEVMLHENGVPTHRTQELADDVEELLELELLDLGDSSRGVTYRLLVPLMAMWIRTNVDFDGLVIRAREEAEANR